MRGTPLGNLWYAELKASDTLKANYAATKGWEAQRKFRAAWEASLWQDLVRKRRETTSYSESSRNLHPFKPISVAIRDKGGDEDARNGVKFFLEKICKMQP